VAVKILNDLIVQLDGLEMVDRKRQMGCQETRWAVGDVAVTVGVLMVTDGDGSKLFTLPTVKHGRESG
jgi:hypothetical protein